jgi:hypothetical protein
VISGLRAASGVSELGRLVSLVGDP